jgi:Tol biopolymer transport system component
LPESGALLPEKLEICVADVHSGDITYIAQNSVPDYFPVWSPDGSRIAFVSVRNGIDLNLYIMDSDGTSERALAPDDYAMAAPLWSPDGDRIAIVVNQQVCIITVDGEDISRFGDSVWPYTPLSWME